MLRACSRRTYNADQKPFGCICCAPMDDLDAWLGTSLGPENLRAEVRQACGGSLEDLSSCELEDLESELSLSTWPNLERLRFLRAWRALRGEENDDDAAADTDEDEAAVAPPEPSPCLLYTSPSPRDRTRSRMPSSA